MSMYWSGGSVTGLLLVSEEDKKHFIDEYIKQNWDEFPDENEPMEDRRDDMDMALSSGEEFRAAGDKSKIFYAMRYDDSVYEGMFFIPSDPESTDVIEVSAKDDPILIASSKILSSRSIFKYGFYHSLDEMIEEFRETVGDYLPEGFDYKASIGDLVYAAFC